MEKFKDAILDSRQVINLAPDQWQGYARCARLFLKLQKLDNALKMVDFAIEHVKEDDTKRKEELSALKQQILQIFEMAQRHKSRTAYHFGKLPVEIACEIFSLVVVDNPAAPVVLSHVCQHWRSVTTKRPSFWSTLILTGRSPVKKIKVWKNRSKAKITELWFREGVGAYEIPIAEELATFLPSSSLRVFRAEVEIKHILECLFIHNISRMFADLDELTLYGSHYYMPFRPMMCAKILEIRDAHVDLGWILDNFARLESLCCSVGVYTRTSSLLQLLRGNSSMSKLRLFPASDRVSKSIVTDISNDEQVVESETLRHLELHRLDLCYRAIASHVSMPSLEVLRLSSMQGSLNDPFQCLLAHTPSLSLNELVIRNCFVDWQSLRKVLQASPRLHTLVLIGLANVGHVVEFLAEPNAHLGNSTPSLPCPFLASVDLSSCADLRSGTVIRLVKARSVEGDHVKLDSLVIDGCPLIEAEALPWLSSKLLRFSCVYMTKKQATRRR
jgi:F-box/TPR repeat protein Pof3